MFRTATVLVPVLACVALAVPTAGSTVGPAPIADSQDPTAAPAFVGRPAAPRPLPANAQFTPRVGDMHGDGGNTNSSPFPGPLGSRPATTSAAAKLSPLVFDPAGRLTAGHVNTSTGTPLYGVAVADPRTLAVTAEWDAPAGQTLNLGYLYQSATGEVLVTSREGHVYVVDRDDSAATPVLHLVRDVDLVAGGVLTQGQSLLNAAFDADGDIWFTTGGIVGLGQDAGTATTLGYIQPDGLVHSLTIANEAVENGIAVSDTTAYVVTGPVAADRSNATGAMYAFGHGGATTVTTLWSQRYAGGSARKPGGFARGSGATPTLLGNRYVAVTDNADDQVALLVYRQPPAPAGRSQLVCRVPLFSPGASANDIGLVGTQTGDEDSVLVLNNDNAPAFQAAPADVNGAFNAMTAMSPGVEKVSVAAGGSGCPVNWNTPLRVKSVPVLSTATGLVYGYTQDSDLAAGGIYAWYFVAVDYRTGSVVWRVRAGGGGTFNDDYKAATLGPDGTLYQGVLGGVAMLAGPCASAVRPG
ncbi:hypothetical protein [Amycolatopsis sp. RTGN1]|uniref:hypothetical protein n=1 Tax=Amycolatopsis ponsaeliensis TaxID=2992142 RepID=UPI00254F1FBB|nr:hypothetical protein [Amycolatopsis sp. RTGN1]